MSKINETSLTERAKVVTGVVLAGGRGRRMGGVDKGLLALEGRAMIEWVLERLVPQVSTVLISANRSSEQYAGLGYQAIADATTDFRGPLAGIAAALSKVDTPWIITVPCDSPLITVDLVSRLQNKVLDRGVRVGVAHDGNRLQPVFMFLHRELLADLESYLRDGKRKIDLWLERHSFESVDFSDSQEMFMNANTPADLEAIGACIKAR